MTFINTLSQELAHAYIETRLDEALSHRPSVQAARSGRSRRRRTLAPASYTDYLTARGEATR